MYGATLKVRDGVNPRSEVKPLKTALLGPGWQKVRDERFIAFEDAVRRHIEAERLIADMGRMTRKWEAVFLDDRTNPYTGQRSLGSTRLAETYMECVMQQRYADGWRLWFDFSRWERAGYPRELFYELEYGGTTEWAEKDERGRMRLGLSIGNLWRSAWPEFVSALKSLSPA